MSSKAEQTTLHGVHWAFDSRLPLLLRLGWIVAILSSWSYMLYLTYSRVTYLSTHPKKTIVDVNYDPRGLEFPAVTICDNNLIKKSTARHLAEYEDLKRFLADYTAYRWSHGGENFPAADYNLSHLTMSDLARMSHRGHDFVGGCQFASRRCRDDLLYTMRTFGHCYTFNALFPTERQTYKSDWSPGPPLYTSQTTSNHGLSMLLWADEEEYFYGYRSDTVGFTVAVHSPHTMTTIDNAVVIRIAPGFLTSIGLSYKR
ncbi:PREDICTED: acid-sensing ion channel 1-like, partial [Priapulus caudatus]|uniref:Acid-sensing ion channel 1-like n=1 Tax=Priapulus caudatus TaxID=37621 RepID=A0ABM1EF26_PRICU